jgi:Tfp pilus assembly protein PilF
MNRYLLLCFAAALWAALAGCAQPPQGPPQGLLDLTDRPAEKALMAGLRAYDDAQYPQAEKQLQAALAAGLASPRDRAAAHKLLAFIFCTSNRAAECEAQFRAARKADPGFTLSRSEAGHPLWGPVYQRVQP